MPERWKHDREGIQWERRKVGITLSQEERKLILGDPIFIHPELADPIRTTPIGTPVLLTLDDLEDLGGYVTAAANHTKDKKLRKKLDAISSKIDGLLDTRSDEEPPKSLKIKNARMRNSSLTNPF